jgi:predicted metal-dependent hydrolase
MKAVQNNIQIDQIIRSQRRTIALEVKRDGSLIVRAPKITPRGQIEELVKSKERWIRKKQELLKQQSLEAPAKKFIPGEQFQYLGEPYALEVVEGQVTPLILDDKFNLAAKSQHNALPVFTNWYRKHASLVIKAIVANRAQQNGFTYARIRITNARTRWGSCGSKGSLNFTWRLIMAPWEVIDYVVVHEMVHLQVRNHSKAFWSKVGKLMPDYQLHRVWLKENGHLLILV